MRMLRARVGPLLVAGMMVAGAAACGDTLGPGEDPGFRAVWAGKSWRGDASASVWKDSLYVVGATPPNAGSLPAAYVWIRVPTQGPGDYPLGPGDAEMVYLTGGDVRTAAYAVTRANAGTLTLREEAGGRVAGTVRFEASAVMERAPVGPTARFEGSFRATVRRP